MANMTDCIPHLPFPESFTSAITGAPVVEAEDTKAVGSSILPLPPTVHVEPKEEPMIKSEKQTPAALSSCPEQITFVPLVLAEAQALIGLEEIKKAKKRQLVPNKTIKQETSLAPSLTCKAVIRAAMNERVRKLDRLSRVNESNLTLDQRNEKKKLMTLEKNRRAAQLSREKKKRYVSSLEGRVGMLAKHLANLELENNQLRAVLGSYADLPLPEGAIIGPPPNMPEVLPPGIAPEHIDWDNDDEWFEHNQEELQPVPKSTKKKRRLDAEFSLKEETIPSFDLATPTTIHEEIVDPLEWMASMCSG